MYQVPLGGIGFTSNVGSLGTNINASNASINNLSVTSATIGQLKTAIFEPITLNTSVINASRTQSTDRLYYTFFKCKSVNSLHRVVCRFIGGQCVCYQYNRNKCNSTQRPTNANRRKQY